MTLTSTSYPPNPQRMPVAGPSTSARLKTPEARPAKRTSVPRAKTPESVLNLSDTTSTVGKKRPLPADFEECDSVPPQAFTPDSVPLGPAPASRARTLPSHRGGFTPVRHHAPGPASPPRAIGAILDVTNSPRGGTAQDAKKRGWLPKSRVPDPSVLRTAAPRR
jgi:hypothetical protein